MPAARIRAPGLGRSSPHTPGMRRSDRFSACSSGIGAHPLLVAREKVKSGVDRGARKRVGDITERPAGSKRTEGGHHRTADRRVEGGNLARRFFSLGARDCLLAKRKQLLPVERRCSLLRDEKFGVVGSHVPSESSQVPTGEGARIGRRYRCRPRRDPCRLGSVRRRPPALPCRRTGAADQRQQERSHQTTGPQHTATGSCAQYRPRVGRAGRPSHRHRIVRIERRSDSTPPDQVVPPVQRHPIIRLTHTNLPVRDLNLALPAPPQHPVEFYFRCQSGTIAIVSPTASGRRLPPEHLAERDFDVPRVGPGRPPHRDGSVRLRTT
jgi:hypothetical protein